MTEADYGPSFQIIAEAGDSKGYSMSAVKAAKTGDFEKAKADLKEADRCLLAAHEFQTEMIRQEAEGKSVPVNIILVHSQDHLSMAMTARDMAEQFVILYQQLSEGKNQNREG